MNKTLSILLVACASFGALVFVQTQRLAQRNRQLATITADRDQATGQLAQAESSVATLEEERQAARIAQLVSAPSQTSSAQVAPPQAVLTNFDNTNTNAGKASDKSGIAKLLSQVLDDPTTRKMVQDQQRAMIDQLYGPLVKQMGLTPEEATRFKDLLAENAMNSAEKAMGLFNQQSGAIRAEMTQSLAAGQKQLDEQMKELLGDARFAQFQDYQQTAPERMQLDQLKTQLSGNNTLTDAQMEQLLAVMKEEKQTTMAGTIAQNLSGGMSGMPDPASMLSDDQVQKWLQAQETMNQNVYQRASTILSPGQMGAFGQFQTNQLHLMQMGIGIAQKLFTENPAQPAQ